MRLFWKRPPRALLTAALAYIVPYKSVGALERKFIGMGQNLGQRLDTAVYEMPSYRVRR